MDLARAKLVCGNQASYIDKLNVIFTQVSIQTKTFLKNTIKIKVIIQF